MVSYWSLLYNAFLEGHPRLSAWAKTWQMEFKVGKYEIMHFSKRIHNEDYYLNGQRLQMSEVQRGLGVAVQNRKTLAGRSTK